MHTTSSTLLERLRDPTDHAAWTRFAQLYTPLLFYWVRRTGLQDSDAQDLVQEILIQLLGKLDEFRSQGQGSFRAWLRTVTLNKWRDRQRRRPVIPQAIGESGAPEPAVSDEIAELTEAEYQQHLVRRALQLMQADFAPTAWRACWMLVVEDRPAAEIAAELGLTAGAVYAAKFRVVARLRQELQGLLD